MKKLFNFCAFSVTALLLWSLLRNDCLAHPMPGPVSVKHRMGTLLLPTTPKRVVVLEFSFADALAVLGVSPVGVADDGDRSRIIDPIRKKLGDWKSVGMRKQPSLELLVSLRPDLIVGDWLRHRSIYKQLSQIAPTVLLDSLGEDFTSDLASLKTLAKALGKDELLAGPLKRHQGLIHEHSKRLVKLKGQKVLFGVTWEKGVHLHTSRSYVPELLAQLGLSYVSLPKDTGTQRPSEKITLEQLLTINPDVLIMARGRPHVLLDEWAKTALWNHLEAVKKGQVYFVDQTLWTRARGLLSSEAMMENLQKVLGGK